MKWILVMLFFSSNPESYIRVEVHTLVSQESCQQVAKWYPARLAVTTGRGVKYWCEQVTQ